MELSGILTWVVDAEESMWLCLLLLAAKFLFLQICIMNLVVFVALKLTLIASKNIIEIYRACIWLNSLTIFTVDPVWVHGNFLHSVCSHTLTALKVKLSIRLVSTWFENRESNLIFFPYIVDLNMFKIEVSSCTFFELTFNGFDRWKDCQICDTIYTSLPIL